MPFTDTFQNSEPTSSEIEASRGPMVLEFGTAWCGFCRAAQPLIKEAFAREPVPEHIKIEDGKGRRLGRHFRVKLWPTLVFLYDGEEVGRLVRPGDTDQIAEQLARVSHRR